MIRFAFSNGLFERPTLNLITRTYQQWYITADLLDYLVGTTYYWELLRWELLRTTSFVPLTVREWYVLVVGLAGS